MLRLVGEWCLQAVGGGTNQLLDPHDVYVTSGGDVYVADAWRYGEEWCSSDSIVAVWNDMGIRILMRMSNGAGTWGSKRLQFCWLQSKSNFQVTKCNNWALSVKTPTALWLVKKGGFKTQSSGTHDLGPLKCIIIDSPCFLGLAASMPPSIRFRGGICCPRTLAMTGFRRLAAGWSPPLQAGGWGKEMEWRRDPMPFAQTSPKHTPNRNWRNETCALVWCECGLFKSQVSCALNESLIISRHRWRTLVPFVLTVGCSNAEHLPILRFGDGQSWSQCNIKAPRGGGWGILVRGRFWSGFVPVESWWVWIGRWPMTSKVSVEGIGTIRQLFQGRSVQKSTGALLNW